MTVAVTGASGFLGRVTAEKLIEKLSPEEVILITRNPEGVAPELRAAGVEIRQADFADPDSLTSAFDSAERAMIVSVDLFNTPHRVKAHTDAFNAAIAAGVKHIAFPSMPRVDENHPTGEYAMEYPRSEDVLKGLEVDWTILQNGPYAEGLIPRAAMAVASGRLTSNAGEGTTAPISHADCAEVAATVLTTEGHEGKSYIVTGPELFSQAQLVELFSEITGRDIELAEVSFEEHPAILREIGLPDPFHLYLPRHLEAVRLGYFDDLTDVVETVTGRPPERLQDILARHRDEMLGG